MRHWRKTAAFAALAGWMLLGCSGAPTSPLDSAPENGTEAAAENLPLASLRLGETPFEIARPAIWEEGFIEGDAVMESWIHPQVELYPNLNVLLQEAPAPGERGVELMYEELARSLPGFKTEEANWQTINGVTGLRSISTWPSIYGDLTALRMMIPWEGKVIVISFVDFTPSFRNNAHAYNRCIDALAPFEPLEIGDSR